MIGSSERGSGICGFREKLVAQILLVGKLYLNRIRKPEMISLCVTGSEKTARKETVRN